MFYKRVDRDRSRPMGSRSLQRHIQLCVTDLHMRAYAWFAKNHFRFQCAEGWLVTSHLRGGAGPGGIIHRRKINGFGRIGRMCLHTKAEREKERRKKEREKGKRKERESTANSQTNARKNDAGLSRRFFPIKIERRDERSFHPSSHALAVVAAVSQAITDGHCHTSTKNRHHH
ncbi:hypothetical protein PUN28_004956 [Cardiocondyla obscurior]|uniref:Uncharacterized protein n=1 Tax=Cardiocondyla obscurior TaxID=286306 RepID=A0AAW2GJ81_9HYME